ncbi:MAG: PIG-L deacetylase family protein [Anaerolineales bacterium]|jgi:LmbE family N-acetylglucosaminyl deacetylase
MSESKQSERTLLAVFAHPDDESFGPGGTLALYAQRGVNVHLICATRGEVGETPEEVGERTDEKVARLRENELRCAAQILGLKEVHFLGYRDSGMPGTETNLHPRALANTPVDEVTEKVAEIARSVQPQVMITFDPIGGYRHPDHIAIQKAAVKAFADLRADDSPEAYKPQKLYYHTFPKRLMRILVRLMPLFGRDPHRFGVNKDIDLVDIAAVDYPIHARIQIRSVTDIKAQASACHASQQGGGSDGIFRFLLRLFGSREEFMRAYPPAPDSLSETDLFTGVE